MRREVLISFDFGMYLAGIAFCAAFRGVGEIPLHFLPSAGLHSSVLLIRTVNDVHITFNLATELVFDALILIMLTSTS